MDILGINSFFITLLIVLFISPIAQKKGLTDKPCSRKKHSGEIPLTGGISIYLCVLILFYWLPINNYWYIVSATLIVACGVIDDFKHLNYKIRLIIEVVATLIMIFWGGVEITNLGNLFGFGDIQLGYFSPLVTIFAVVGGINAFNMTDGIDGSTGGISLITMSLLLMLANAMPQVTGICSLFIPALTAFLFFNMRAFGRKKAAIFLGDAGSMLLGFTICYLIILISQGENRIISPVTVLWIIGFPLLDAIAIMLRRMRKGNSPFAPDREHFHHILPLAGYTHHQTLNIIFFASLSLAAFGIIGEKLFELPEWLMFYLFLGLFFLYYLGMSHAWKMMKMLKKIHAN
ncbi:hypothetical protein AU255_08615 [Methyloprofundus sedimenti]|uniref:Undecaprenyl-phosphate alpha-N-acetylglucosaminyl 1-phosphate transferase n=1 Tax=Methyloprofundus sedimenti TaxID=1420851 RepID=A0A1V8M8S0_9GAMM|nr:UDP-N-acetylglucosamine--undecaprenyl-phosphate N-acetylglucosaminephosphotransferase [Methyloprofundus sedimenti]OQK17908.1 hypothetical protein AU255_08615 [Methyloprofundus sedimenti]